MRPLPSLVLAFIAAARLVSACSSTGEPRDTGALDATEADAAWSDDARTALDAPRDAPPVPCAVGDPVPWSCVPASTRGPVCSEVRLEPTCSGGAWTCPFTSVPAPTRGCECFATPSPIPQRCACTDGGVRCVDLVDTGPGP